MRQDRLEHTLLATNVDRQGLIPAPGRPLLAGPVGTTAIGRLLDDLALAEEMGAAGRRRARRLFGKERYARLVAEIYEEVLR